MLLSNVLTGFELSDLPFHDADLWSLISLLSLNYEKKGNLYRDVIHEATDVNSLDVLVGFASLFRLVKASGNVLVAEVSQVCSGKSLRAIAFGATEGLSTWKVSVQLSFRPVTVPVGRMTLGRIFNVVGSMIDSFCGTTCLEPVSNHGTHGNVCNIWNDCTVIEPSRFESRNQGSEVTGQYRIKLIHRCLEQSYRQHVGQLKLKHVSSYALSSSCNRLGSCSFSAG